MSSWDFTAQSAFDTAGAIAFPGVDGYSRNLWDTTYDNWGPRVGAAYQWNDRTVLRGGFGITYLPTNTGYFSSPVDYGVANFAGGVLQQAYGTSPAGVPVIRFSDPAPVSPAIGGVPEAPQVYGIGEARFDRHLKNGQARQWNFFIERALSARWMASIGYSASVSRNLHNRSFPIRTFRASIQRCSSQWRDQFIASNGTLNPATQLVQDPLQPATGPLCRLPGSSASARSARSTRSSRIRCSRSNAAVNLSQATADYHAMICASTAGYANGTMPDATYTWSKEIDNTDTVEATRASTPGQARAAGTTASTTSISTGASATATSRIGSWRRASTSCRSARATDRRVDRWSAPCSADGRSSGSDLADRIPAGDYRRRRRRGPAAARSCRGCGTRPPENLWGWYDGRTQVTLPSGRIITPPAVPISNTTPTPSPAAW